MKSYYGVDVAKDCVEKLHHTYNDMQQSYRRRETANRGHHNANRVKPLFEGHFLCTDMTSPDLSDQLRRHIKLSCCLLFVKYFLFCVVFTDC